MNKPANRLMLLGVLSAFAVGSALAQTPGTTDPNGTDWISPPALPIPVDIFMSQFWGIVNWFTPLIIPLVGLGVGTWVLRRLLANAFKGGD